MSNSIIIDSYKNGETFKVTKYLENGIELSIKGTLTAVCNEKGLAVRDIPSLLKRDAWYKTEKGWVSAYRVEGKIIGPEYNWTESYNHVRNIIKKKKRK